MTLCDGGCKLQQAFATIATLIDYHYYLFILGKLSKYKNVIPKLSKYSLDALLDIMFFCV